MNGDSDGNDDDDFDEWKMWNKRTNERTKRRNLVFPMRLITTWFFMPTTNDAHRRGCGRRRRATEATQKDATRREVESEKYHQRYRETLPSCALCCVWHLTILFRNVQHQFKILLASLSSVTNGRTEPFYAIVLLLSFIHRNCVRERGTWCCVSSVK